MMRHTDKSIRRFVLAALSLGATLGPAFAGGCAGGFAPISQVEGLRVLSVVADKPYLPVCEGDTVCPPSSVTFQMTHVDTLGRPVEIVWLGGCVNPTGDQYYGCYEQFAKYLPSKLDASTLGPLLQSGLVGLGDTFTMAVPDTLVTSREEPASGPYYGIAYAFFLACAGTLGPVPAEGDGLAGSFPIGCFDAGGNRLGADSFVPGYTQVYAFADGRTNANPVIQGLTMDGNTLPADTTTMPEVEHCNVPDADRNLPKGCGRADPSKECTAYEIEVVVPSDVAEIDPSGTQSDGTPLREVVWVDYFVERGNLNADAKLVSDAVQGYQDRHTTTLFPPAEAGPMRIWAVVHDARGGQAVIERTLMVK